MDAVLDHRLEADEGRAVPEELPEISNLPRRDVGGGDEIGP